MAQKKTPKRRRLKQGKKGAETVIRISVGPEMTTWITPQPKLEEMPVWLYVNSPWVFDGKVEYTAFIEYLEHGRQDKSTMLKESVTPPAGSNEYRWKLDFKNIIQGGTTRHQGTLRWKNVDTGETGILPFGDYWNVRGKNPSKVSIKARLGSIHAQVIAFKESRFRQFDSAGLPLFGPPNGFGIMQIDTPPPTARQIWDWKQNVDAGKALIKTKEKESKQHYKNLYNKYPDARKLTAEEFKLAKYQYYNGGWYWEWNSTRKSWEKGKITAYGDDALHIEKLVKSGTPPNGWD